MPAFSLFTRAFHAPRRQPLGWAAALLSAVLLAGCGTSPERAKPVAAAQPATDRVGMAFARIPAGEFLMGSDESPAALAKAFPHADPRRLSEFKDEAPVHRVRITHDFWMGTHEVTVGQFREFLR